MKRIKVLDLNKFALEHIFRPYWGLINPEDKRLEKLPMKLADVVTFCRRPENKEWFSHVKNRLNKLKFYFPSYIQHEIVDAVKSNFTGYYHG